ncbi:MAG: hypothetical protein GY765_42450 [bacterium]|nr:hypothetical protein [bacterium]
MTARNKDVEKKLLKLIGICCLVPLLYGVMHFRIKYKGIGTDTNLNFKPKQVKYFLQNDDQWLNDEIGNSGRKMSSHGCLVTILASAIDGMGYSTNPGELNRRFAKNGVYLDNGDVVWYKIKKVFPTINYKYRRIFSSRTLEYDLAEGRLPMVKVRYYKTGVFHWVLIVGTDGDDFLAMDPLKQDKEIIKLSVHGNIYAYRVLKST